MVLELERKRMRGCEEKRGEDGIESSDGCFSRPHRFEILGQCE